MDKQSSITREIDEKLLEERKKPGKSAFIIVLAGERMGEVFPLTSSTTIIGRGVTAGIRINDEGISREHASVVSEDGMYYLQDVGSTNGTFVNGEQTQHHLLKEGDKVELGVDCVLRFTFENQKEEQKTLYESALRDSLTGLFNRNYFTNRLESDVAFALRHGTSLSLLMLELDRFLEIQQKHGKDSADLSLRTVATHVRSITRYDDVFARYEDDSFCLICRGINTIRAYQAAMRIKNAIAAQPFHIFESEPERKIHITLSLGISDLHALQDPTAEGLMEATKSALLSSKRNGPNGIEVFNPESDSTRLV